MLSNGPSCFRRVWKSALNCFRPDRRPRHPVPVVEHRTDASLFDIMEDCERHIIVEMLEKCNWNQTDAAERFQVPLSTLNQKIKRLNIEIKKKTRE